MLDFDYVNLPSFIHSKHPYNFQPRIGSTRRKDQVLFELKKIKPLISQGDKRDLN